MIWLKLIAYLVICTVGLMVVLEGYAWLLRRVARLPHPLLLLLGILLYCVIACLFALPGFGLELVLGSLYAYDTIRYVGIIGWGVSLWIAALFFRYRHLAVLKSHGYFQR